MIYDLVTDFNCSSLVCPQQEIDDLVAATKRLVVQVVGKEAGFDQDSIKKRDKAALIASIAKLESEVCLFDSCIKFLGNFHDHSVL